MADIKVLCNDCYDGDYCEYTMQALLERPCAICGKLTKDHLVPDETVELIERIERW